MLAELPYTPNHSTSFAGSPSRLQRPTPAVISYSPAPTRTCKRVYFQSISQFSHMASVTPQTGRRAQGNTLVL